jgi:hypothetical protein
MGVTPVAGGRRWRMTVGAESTGEIRRLRTRIWRPESGDGACQEKEKNDPCFSVASPDSLIHAFTPPGLDFFPGHRQPPFNEITLISSSNEPPIGERTRDQSPSVAGSSNSLSAVLSFDNVILISPPPFLNFLRKYCTTI